MNFVIRPGKYEDCTGIFAISFGEDGHIEVPSYNTLKLNPEKLWKVVPYWMENESVQVQLSGGKIVIINRNCHGYEQYGPRTLCGTHWLRTSRDG